MEEEKKKKKPAARKTIKATRVIKTRTAKAKALVAEVAAESIEVAVDPVRALEYLYAIGRRKSSVAQVRLFRKGNGKMTVNERDYLQYFPRFDLQETLRAPLKAVGQLDSLDVWAWVSGGGIRGQAEAVRLGIARALVKQNPTFRVSLKRLDFLRRDPREKERKKYGLKKARRAPQWAKR